MKKFLLLLMAASMCVSMSGCAPTGVEDGSSGSSEIEQSTMDSEGQNDSDVSDEGFIGDSVVIDESMSGGEDGDPALSVNTGATVKDAIEATSPEEPAPLGAWIKSARYSPVSGEYETVYWRIIGTTFDCQDELDRYNSEEHIYIFEDPEQEDIDWCMVTYEVFFPKEFSAQEWGISSPELSLSAVNPTGGGIEYKGIAWVGLGSCTDITEKTDVFPGDTWTGKALYPMIHADGIEYVFEYGYSEPGSEDNGLAYAYSESK